MSCTTPPGILELCNLRSDETAVEEFGGYATSAYDTSATNLAFGAPVAVLGRYLHGTESVDCDAEDGVDGTQTDGVVERQPDIAEHRTQRPVLACSHAKFHQVLLVRKFCTENLMASQ